MGTNITSSLQVRDFGAVKVVIPRRFADERGFFAETYNEKALAEVGISARFIQDSQSRSNAIGTLRGLHFQAPPYAQAKLVRVLRGRIFDVAVDVRRGSPTFCHWVGIELSADSGAQLFIPDGFAHGFSTLELDTEVLYKVSAPYAPAHEGGYIWSDERIDIRWPLDGDPILSPKDRMLPRLTDVDSPFLYTGDPLLARNGEILGS